MESPLIHELVELLQSRQATLALAESCTGGLLSASLVRVSGVSTIYKGGVVSYHNRVKETVLGIPRTLIRTHGAVSRPVAREMARSARDILEASWGCSITGIAGPNGGTPTKPVGTVFFGIVGPGVEVTEHAVFGGDRTAIQDQSVDFALHLLLASVRGNSI